jgi:hypothetical protein
MIVPRWLLSMDQQRKDDSIFSQEKTPERKSMGGSWSEEGIDKMEGLVKEIRLDRGEDPGDGRVEMTGAMRDNYF